VRQSTTNLLEGERQVKPKRYAKAANDYYEAHGYAADNHDHRHQRGTHKTE